VALIPVNRKRQLVGEPQLVNRGFMHLDSSAELLIASRKEIKRQVSRGNQDLKQPLEQLFYKMTQLHPVVLPQFIQV